MDFRRLTRELELTRRDRIGALVLAFLVILAIYLPNILNRELRARPEDSDTTWMAAIRELEARSGGTDSGSGTMTSRTTRYRYPARENRSLTPFIFDPNTASAAELERLGLPERTVKTILNFREKGGRFRTKEDLRKIYGLKPEHYEILQAFVRIQGESVRYPNQETGPVEKPNRMPAPFDINLADSTAFIALPGIGSKLSQRIILFREKLGGFYSINQVSEVYGLADSVFQKIRPYLLVDKNDVKKININGATEEELRAHPYIRFQVARAIIAYRNAHGPFPALEDLKKVMAVTNELFEKLKPYLSAGD